MDIYNAVSAVPFLSTPSGWRATLADMILAEVLKEFLSTPSGWRATLFSTAFRTSR